MTSLSSPAVLRQLRAPMYAPSAEAPHQALLPLRLRQGIPPPAAAHSTRQGLPFVVLGASSAHLCPMGRGCF